MLWVLDVLAVDDVVVVDVVEVVGGASAHSIISVSLITIIPTVTGLSQSIL